MKLKLNRAAALTLTGTAILATLSQVGGAAPRSYIEGQDHENSNEEQVKADDLKADSTGHFYQNIHSPADYIDKNVCDKVDWDLSGVANATQGIPLKVDFSFPASYAQKGNRILLYTITHNTPAFTTGAGVGSLPIYDQNNNLLGNLSTTTSLKNGVDQVSYWLNVTTEKKFTDQITGSFQHPFGFQILGYIPGAAQYLQEHHQGLNSNITDIFYGNGQKIFTANAFISSIKRNVTINTSSPAVAWTLTPYSWAGFGFIGLPTIQHDNSDISSIDSPATKTTNFHHVIEMSGPQLKISNLQDRELDSRFFPISADGYTMNEMLNYYDPNKKAPVKQLTDNLTPQQVYDQTPDGYMGYSKHADNDYIVCFNFNTDTVAMNNPDIIKNSLENRSIFYNLQDPQHKQEILDNTLKYYKNVLHNAPILTVISSDFTSPDTLLMVRDVTPNGNNSTSVGYIVNGSGNSNTKLLINSAYQFIDDTTGANVGPAVIKSGKTGDHGTLSLTVPSGFKLARGQTLPTTYNILDHNTLTLIHLVHATQKKNNSSGVGTRRITYIGAPKNPDPVTQTVHFSRTDTVDDATDKVISSSDWQPTDHNGQWDAVNTPIITGYKPDKAIVPADKASVGTTEVKVTYSKADQHAKLTVHDDTANTDLNDYTENSTGLYQDQINFKTAPSAVEQELKDKGYNIVSDSFKGSPTYNADDSKNNFVIHVTHKIVPVTPDQPKTPTDVIPDTKQHYPTGVDTNDLNKDVQRSIFYKYEDNTQAEPTVVQKAHFDRTVKVDAVTQKIVDNGTWATKDNYPEVATKSIDGYTPDKTKVDSATPSMTTNQDQTVVYHANDEDAAITYIDDTTGKVLKTDTQKAKYKQTIKFATDPNTQIQTYKDQGYILVSSDWKDGSTYQTDPARNKFTVHLKHGTSTVTPDKPKKPTNIIPGTKQHYPTGVDTNDLNQPQQRQITYTYADSKKQASPTVTQKATFHRTATVDNVTGKTTYTDWTTSGQYPEVKSPTIEGYTPDKQTVPVTKPVLNTKQDVAVVYNPNPEQVDVIAQDNTGKQLSKSTLHGNYNTDYTATTPVIKGYHLIKMPTNTHGTYKTHNDPIVYIYAPDSNSVPEQTDGTPKPDKSSYPDDLTPAKRSNKLPETGNITLASELSSDIVKVIHNLF